MNGSLFIFATFKREGRLGVNSLMGDGGCENGWADLLRDTTEEGDSAVDDGDIAENNREKECDLFEACLTGCTCLLREPFGVEVRDRPSYNIGRV